MFLSHLNSVILLTVFLKEDSSEQIISNDISFIFYMYYFDIKLTESDSLMLINAVIQIKFKKIN